MQYVRLLQWRFHFLLPSILNWFHTGIGFKALEDCQKFSLSFLITTIYWITITLLTKPSDIKTLSKFYSLIKPGGPGWKNFIKNQKEKLPIISESRDLPGSILSVFLGSVTIYGALFSIGYWLYANYTFAIITSLITMIFSFLLITNIRRKFVSLKLNDYFICWSSETY